MKHVCTFFASIFCARVCVCVVHRKHRCSAHFPVWMWQPLRQLRPKTISVSGKFDFFPSVPSEVRSRHLWLLLSLLPFTLNVSVRLWPDEEKLHTIRACRGNGCDHDKHTPKYAVSVRLISKEALAAARCLDFNMYKWASKLESIQYWLVSRAPVAFDA